MSRMRWAIVTCCGLGLGPIAPGTWGSAGAAAVAGVVYLLTGPAVAFDVAMGVLAVLAIVGGVACGPWAVKHFGSKDPKPFVVDEAAGQWVALVGLPHVALWPMVAIVAVQFLLFRVADIIKPSPARELERLPHGWGIVFDDVAAGVYANLVGQLIFRVWMGWS